MSRPFASAYLAGEAGARAFFAHDFRDPAARVARTRAAASRWVDPRLLAVLRAQQNHLPPSAARSANVEMLARGGTAVVATGQQVGLFLGPLYSFYKAASAVAVARALSAEAGVPCVPLFWLQTEDHDFAEIATATVADRRGVATRLALAPESAAEARVSIAHRHLGAEVDGLVERLADALPPGVAADQTLALLRAHYVGGRSLAAAFAGAMATLFADEGLLVFDPREARVGALAAPIYREALRGAASIQRALWARRAALAEAGFDEQIALRDRCSLLFFHRGDACGPRYRLQKEGAEADVEKGGDWSLAGGGETISQQAIEATIDGDPLRLSTSALLRPIVQDKLWPTAAYVAGPGELNYLAQLGPLYEHFSVAAPLAVPRARFRCLDARTRRLLTQLRLTVGDVSRPERELHAQLARAVVETAGPNSDAGPDPATLRARVSSEIAPMVDEIARLIAQVRPELAPAAERTRGTVAHALGRLVDRYTRAVAERDGVVRERLARVKAALVPDGVPQERAYSWPSMAARVGPSAFTGLVLSAVAENPFATELRELHL
ncbi:MAG: bacillithiol biosynthesis cysteine-adding enzyme BshC [Polyangia bacterium]